MLTTNLSAVGVSMFQACLETNQPVAYPADSGTRRLNTNTWPVSRLGMTGDADPLLNQVQTYPRQYHSSQPTHAFTHQHINHLVLINVLHFNILQVLFHQITTQV